MHAAASAAPFGQERGIGGRVKPWVCYLIQSTPILESTFDFAIFNSLVSLLPWNRMNKLNSNVCRRYCILKRKDWSSVDEITAHIAAPAARNGEKENVSPHRLHSHDVISRGIH